MNLTGDLLKSFLAVSFATVVSIWIWPSNFFDIPFAQMTFKILFQFIGSIVIVLWCLANLYNRLGPYLSQWIIKRSLPK